jgi:ABC transporter substrate binding protein
MNALTSSQQSDRVRRIGVLMFTNENDPEGRRRVSAFTQALADLGWTEGRNMRMDLRWGGGDLNRMRALAQELVGLQPDIIVTNGTTLGTVAVQRETRTIAIVFANVGDPVASGLRNGVHPSDGLSHSKPVRWLMASIIVWDIETVPDLKGFAAANEHAGASDEQVREAMGDKFPKTSTTRSSASAHWLLTGKMLAGP